MSRRGLVSKSFGPSGGSPGGAALVPKGEGGPPSSGILSIEDVAATLRVTPQQVSEWVRKDMLRANDSGVKPYDLKKFQYDSREEIARAQAQALRESQRPVEKSHQKSVGFFSKLFGKGKSRPASDDAGLAKENQRLREELKKAKAEPQDESATSRLEEKVRYLEERLSRTSGLENENAALRQQLATSESAATNFASPDSSELTRELEQTRRELEASRDALLREEELRQELSVLQGERVRLEAEVFRLESRGETSSADPELEREFSRSQETVRQLEARLQHQEDQNGARLAQLESELTERDRAVTSLQEELEQVRATIDHSEIAPTSEPSQAALVEELLALQEANLARFTRLKELKEQAEQKLSQNPAGESLSSDSGFAKLQADFDRLRVKHQSLLEARENNDSGQQEFAEQLAAARVTATRLKQENTALKNRLVEADVEGWKLKTDELQRRLREASSSSDQGLEQMELELRATRKSLQAREAQVQKIAGRVQENERALKKALKESTRLTELLIERENRLRDLSTEYEQEYRDKIDNLDRQVSGLQWKLSLREERIASLESEVSELRRQTGRD